MEKKWNLAVRWPTYFISQRQFFPWYIFFFFFFRPRKKRVPRIPPVPCIFPMAPTIVLLAFLKDQPRSHEMLAAFIFIPLSRPVPTENKIKRFSVIPSWLFFFFFAGGFRAPPHLRPTAEERGKNGLVFHLDRHEDNREKKIKIKRPDWTNVKMGSFASRPGLFAPCVSLV